MDPVQQPVDDAKRVLYNLDPVDGSIISKSKLYEMYEKNAAEYARAKSDYAVAYAKARSDPAALQAWPYNQDSSRAAMADDSDNRSSIQDAEGSSQGSSNERMSISFDRRWRHTCDREGARIDHEPRLMMNARRKPSDLSQF